MSDFEDIAHKTVAELFDMLKEKQYTVDALSEINHEKDSEIADLKTQLNNMEACYIEKKKQVEDALSRIESLMVHAAADYENTKSTSMMCAVQELGKTLRGEHE